MVPFGDVTFLRSCGGLQIRPAQELAGTCHRGPGQPLGELVGQPRGDARLLQTFGKQEYIGRTAARHGRHGIEQRLVLDPDHLAHRGQQAHRIRASGSAVTLALAMATVMPWPTEAGVLGMARTTATVSGR